MRRWLPVRRARVAERMDRWRCVLSENGATDGRREMTTLADIDRLASSIAALVTAQARSSDFWDYDDIAYHLRASKSTAMKWAALPDFPRPIRPPTDGAGKGHPRFLPAEVRKWAMSHREGATGRVGRPRKEAA